MKRAVALFAFLTFVVVTPSASGAEFGIVPGSFKVRMLDAEGNPENRAGSHPDRLQIDFGLSVEGTGTSPKDLVFEFPPGFGGSPGAVPECSRELFEKGEEECPAESQVGTLSLKLSGGGESTLPIFEVEPAPDEVIAFGSISGFDVPLTMELRPGDFGLTFKASDLPEAPVSEGHIEMWGVPADNQTGTSIPRRPFLTTPTHCGPLSFTFRTRSSQPDAPWLEAGATTEVPLGDCEALAFEPKLGLQLTNPVADSPTGTRIDLNIPQTDDPDGLASAQIKNAIIDLPEGLTVSPGGAGGLAVCSDAELGLGTTADAQCPPSSRVGTVEVESPALPDPIMGVVYLGEERPGERFRMFVVAPGPGIVVKFVSTLNPDPTTGRLSASLRDLPQFPVSRLALGFDGGPQALLASPLTCGSFASVGRFESYSGGPTVESSALVTIGAGADGSQCPSVAPFSPRLIATSSRYAAGGSTAFSMTLLRRPGEQLTRRFAVSLPMGMSAALGEIEPCPDPGAANGACPASSRVGGAVAEVGSGSSPVALHGDVYVAGAYHRAPFSLIMAFHAALGPFDLGTLAVRTGVQLDPRTGRVTVQSDALPQVIAGVSVRLQSIGMTIDRPGLIHNPTSCGPTTLDASFESSGGASATATSAIPVRSCKKLGFKPRFSVALSDRSQLHRHGKPGLQITTRFRQRDTNLRSLRMSLPRPLKFDISGLGEICPRLDAIDNLCSAGARVGKAYARSPILGEPLEGSMYVVQPKGKGQPDLWLSLEAMGVQVQVRGRTSVYHGRLVTNLVGLPDVPLSVFAMRLRGGEHGILTLRSEPCSHDRGQGLEAGLAAKGQNGAHRTQQLRAKASCGSAPAAPAERPSMTRALTSTTAR